MCYLYLIFTIDNIARMKFTKIIKLENITGNLRIERYAYILDSTIQPVYKYIINNKCICTYYTNGGDYKLYPVYHDLENWPKEKIEMLLERYLPLEYRV